MKYEQDILDKGIYFKENNFNTGCYGKEFSKYNRQTGYCIYQHPLQFSSLLEFLEDKKINNYLEIGVWFGGTFRYLTEFLNERNEGFYSVGVDLKPPTRQVKKLIEEGLAYYVMRDTIRLGTDYEIEKYVNLDKLDLCLIDGNHTYNYIKNDWEKYGKHAKYCLFHDIAANEVVPDVKEFWDKEIKPKYKTIELLDHYPNKPSHFGIGIVINEN